jgi:organic hydroperoxide reductase OsmC/OhrA
MAEQGSDHSAQIHWVCDGTFLNKRYSRRHQWRFDGGAVVPGSSSPWVVPTPWSDAAAVDPEEAFVACLASCHMLWFLDFACQGGYSVASYTDDALGHMAPNDKGQLVMARVTLRPLTVFAGGHQPSQQALVDLHHRAHEACFLANSVKTEIVVEPTMSTL